MSEYTSLHPDQLEEIIAAILATSRDDPVMAADKWGMVLRELRGGSTGRKLSGKSKY